jgi:acetyl-CoA synthetase
VADNWWQTELGAPTIGTTIGMAAVPGAAGCRSAGRRGELWWTRTATTCRKGKGGLLVLRRPFPHMMRTIWGNHHRYEQYWTEIPGCYAAGDVASVG